MIGVPPRSTLFPYTALSRSRPELLAVFAAAGIDVVCTANNHSGDYGSAALLEQGRVLDGMNLGHAGSGPDRVTACRDRKSTRLNSSHANISYAVFCLKKKNQ